MCLTSRSREVDLYLSCSLSPPLSSLCPHQRPPACSKCWLRLLVISHSQRPWKLKGWKWNGSPAGSNSRPIRELQSLGDQDLLSAAVDKKKLKKNLKTPAALVTSFRVSTSDLSLIYYSKRPLSSFYFIFYFLINVQSPPTVSSLGHCCNNQPYSGDAGKWCPNLPSLLLPRFLPLVKLPAGYYRDVFINAVYGSLSALFFLCVYLLISCTQCPLKLPPFFSLFFLFLTGVFFLTSCFLLHSSLLPTSSALSPYFFFLAKNLIILLISSPAAVPGTECAGLTAPSTEYFIILLASS